MYADETLISKTRRKSIIFLLICIFLFEHFVSSTPVILCPEFCECSINKNGLQSASCMDLVSNGTSFPNIHVLALKPSDVGVDCYIPEDVAVIFPQLNYLELQNCSLSYIPSNSFRELKSLEEIDLSNNFLRKFSHSIFASNTKLRYVNLHNNPLNISTRPLLSSNSIWEIDLSACNISQLLPSTFKNLPNLKYLTLSNNQISSVNENTLPNGIKQINLQRNNITNAPIGELNRLKRLREVDISENPINCTCELMNFHSWLSSKAIIFTHLTKCAYPKEYSGRSLVSLPQYYMCDAKIERESLGESCTPGQICSNQILLDDGYVMDQAEVTTEKLNDLLDFLPVSSENSKLEQEGSGYPSPSEEKNEKHENSTVPAQPVTETESNEIFSQSNSEKIINPATNELQSSNNDSSLVNVNQNPASDENFPFKKKDLSKFSARYMIPSLLILAIILICFMVYFSHHNCRAKGWRTGNPKTNNTTEMNDVNPLSSDPLLQNGNKYSSKYPTEGETGQTEKLMNDAESSEETVNNCTMPNGHSAIDPDVPEPVQTVFVKVTTNLDSIPKTPTIIRKD